MKILGFVLNHCKEKSVSNYIYDLAEDVLPHVNLLDNFTIAPFQMKVTSLKRSFVDKCFAVCDYYLKDTGSKRLSRHLYDLHKLLEIANLDNSLVDLFIEVKKQRAPYEYCPSAKGNVTLSKVLNQIIESDYYRNDYIEVTKLLLFEDIIYEEVAASLNDIICFLKDFGI